MTLHEYYITAVQLKGKERFRNPFSSISLIILDRFKMEKKSDVEDSEYRDVSDMPRDQVGRYYDRMATDYNRVVVEKWGYTLPSAVADSVSNFVQGKKGLRILDLGCGNGLVGAELRKKNLNVAKMVGMDISQGMLDGAKPSGDYTALVKADLSKPLPVEGTSFDLILCVGTSTYIEPTVLTHWLDLLVPGTGLLCLTHKTAVMSKWENEQNRLVDCEKMCLEHESEPLPYLPGFSEERRLHERVKIYIFGRC